MGDTRPCDREEIPLHDSQNSNGTGERHILRQDRTIPAYAIEATELGRQRHERQERKEPIVTGRGLQTSAPGKGHGPNRHD